MKFLWLALALLFQVCSTSNLSFPMHHHILLLQKQSKANSQIKEQALSNFVTFPANNSANHSEILLNVTVLDQEQDDSLIHIKTMSAFCELTASRGVSFIISLDKMSHPNVIDIYAGYIGIPVLKMFYSDQPHPVKQEWSSVLFLEPDPVYRLEVICELLKKFHWDRVVVISQESDHHNIQMASSLTTMLYNESYLNVLISFLIGIDKTSHLRAINIVLSLRVTAVVLLLERDLAMAFLEEAQDHGFMNLNCVWIIGQSYTYFESMYFPLLGKLLGIFHVQREINLSPPKKEDYLKDSLEIIRQTLQNIKLKGETLSPPPKNCSSLKRWRSGELLYKRMESLQIDGYTGRIHFDGNGFRINIEYDVYGWLADDKSSVTKMIVAQYRRGILRIMHRGWPEKTAEENAVDSKISEGSVVRVTAMSQEPYIVINRKYLLKNESCALGLPCLTRDGEQSCCSGYCVDLLKLLMKDIGFAPILHLVKDGKYGAFNHTTGQWNGLIGEVVRGEAEIALADLTINQQRSAVVDFTHPFLGTGMGVMVKVYRRGKNNWTGFLDPFAVTLWLSLIIIINLVLLCFWLLERFSPYGTRERGKLKRQNNTFIFVEAIWYTWSLVFQTFDVGTRPKSFASRILALSFAFGMLIVITSYTANLAAFLVVEEEILPLNSQGIRDLKLQNPPAGFRIATVQDSSFERFFQATNDPVFNRIWQYMRHDSVKNFSEGIKELESGKLQAFVGDYPTFQTFAAKRHDCSFKVVGKVFFQSGFGLALLKNSTLTARISEALIHYEEYDTARTLRHRWFVGKCSVENEEGAIFARLSLQGLGGLFLAICFAVVISFTFFVIENYTGLFRTSSKYIFRR